jgi:hypothetical protein
MLAGCACIHRTTLAYTAQHSICWLRVNALAVPEAACIETTSVFPVMLVLLHAWCGHTTAEHHTTAAAPH